MRGYHCTEHKHSFGLTESPPPSTAIAMIDNQPSGVLIMPRTIVTYRFWDQIVGFYQQTANFSEVARLITSQWLRQFEFHKLQVSVLGVLLYKLHTLNGAIIVTIPHLIHNNDTDTDIDIGQSTSQHG